MNLSPQGILCDIFVKCSEPKYKGIEMICMPHAHSNISIIVKLGVINSQFYEFGTLCSCERFFVSQMLNVIILLKNKGLPYRDFVKEN
jgi:hypothetical protein